MKQRRWLFLWVLVAVLAFAGCGDDNGLTPRANNDPKNTGAANATQGAEGPTKTPTKAPVNKRTEEYEVAAYDQYGALIEKFKFDENYAHFTNGAEEEWSLDLLGNNIPLIRVLTFNTNVTVFNGGFITSEKGYIENKRTLRLGKDEDEKGRLALEMQGRGLVNDGNLELKNFDISVVGCTAIENNSEMQMSGGKLYIQDGTGIDNAGNLSVLSFYEAAFAEDVPDSDVVRTNVNEGLLLLNRGDAYFNNFLVSGSAECYVKNTKKLTMRGCRFEGARAFSVRNESGASLEDVANIYVVDKDGATGLLNDGEILAGNLMSVFYVSAGTGIVNNGKMQGTPKAFITGGVGFINYGTAFTDDGTAARFQAEVDAGTAVINEKDAVMGGYLVNMKTGTAVVNRGTIGAYDGWAQLSQVRIVSETYKETAFVNEETGTLKGWLHVYTSGLENACVVENKGKIEADKVEIDSGVDIEIYPDWNALSYNSYDGASMSVTPNQSRLCKDSVILKSYTDTKIDLLNICMVGKGEGIYEGYHVVAGTTADIKNITCGVYGSNSAGMAVESGSVVNISDTCIVYAGIQNDTEFPVNTSMTPGYYNIPVYDAALCFGNTGYLNAGMLHLVESSAARIWIYGADNVGFDNTGIITGDDLARCDINVIAAGSANIGLKNSGSVDNIGRFSAYVRGQRLSETTIKTDKNTAVVNSGIIKAGEFSANSYMIKDTPEYYDVLEVYTSGDDSGDTAVANDGTIEVTGLFVVSRIPGNTSILNNNWISAEKASIDYMYGKAYSCTAKSYNKFKELNVNAAHQEKKYYDRFEGTGIVTGSVIEVEKKTQVWAYGPKQNGIMILEGGSLLSNGDYYEYDYVYSEGGATGIANFGHLKLGYTDIRRRKATTWSSCILDQGIFEYTPYPDDIYGEHGCPGPWMGIRYNDPDNT
ncbi:MAG: hypothetical protein J6113_07265 [Lachnospiraceae bacterium]|nr:hypothetical protein [Lachnospiraceae bacterium]